MSKPSYCFGLLGKKLGHSLSEVIMNHFFKTTGVAGRYLLIELENHKSFCRFASMALREKVFNGFNVTVPYKEWAFSISEVREKEALSTGSANVLYLKDGKIVSANTDVYGFTQSLKKNFPELEVKKALIIGAGGAARSVIFALAQMDVQEAVIIYRTKERALNLANFFSGKVGISITISDAKEIVTKNEKFDLIVNATPVGMFPDTEVSPVSEDVLHLLSPRGVVFDLIYNPVKTKLLRICENRSINTLNGLEMLVLQAAKSFEIWTGIYPEIKGAFEEAYKRLK